MTVNILSTCNEGKSSEFLLNHHFRKIIWDMVGWLRELCHSSVYFRMERFLARKRSWKLCSLIFQQSHSICKVFSPRIPQCCSFSTKAVKEVDPLPNAQKTAQIATKELTKVLLDPPTNCCMSGCSNCVWIAYAENLAKLSVDGGEQAKKIIEQHVSDPCLKAFLLTELKMRK